MPAGLAWSGGQDRQADAGTLAERRDRLKGHVAGPLDRPLVVLLEQEGADETGDRRLVGEDADDVGAPLDLAVQTLERVDRVQLGPMGRSTDHRADAGRIKFNLAAPSR